jgi:hypothetical protein
MGDGTARSRIAAQLEVAWWRVMDQVIDRGTPLIEDPARLDPPLGDPIQAPVRTVGGDETAFLRATGQHPTYQSGAVRHRHRRPDRGAGDPRAPYFRLYCDDGKRSLRRAV